MQSFLPTAVNPFIQRETGFILVLVALPQRNLAFHDWCLSSGAENLTATEPG
jgi:hypothetical protein